MKLAPGLNLTEVDEDTVLFDENTGKYWHLNDVGTEVVRAVLADRDVSEVAADISKRTGAEYSVVDADCRGLLEQMVSAGLVDAR